MKISSWKGIHIATSAKRDVVLLLTLFLFNCFQFSTWEQLGQVATKPWLLLVWLYGLIGLVPLAWRDRAPVTVFATQCVHTVAAWPIMSRYIPIVGIPIALYAVAAHCSRKISLLSFLVSFIPNGLAVVIIFRAYSSDAAAWTRAPTSISLFLVLAAAGAWGAGRLLQASRRHIQHLERERDTIREAVAAERRKIAHELHDIVSHAVTGIVLQAAGAARVTDTVAARVTDTDFTQIARSLEQIITTGIQAMAELRRLLGVLRANDPSPASHATSIDELGPQPGLADLTALLTSLRATGMPVTVHHEGTPRDLDPSVDLAAYRIVQEGLTNILKHAGKDANPQLRLVWETQSLIIQLDNGTDIAETARGQALSVGHGLMGLRERAHAVGGHLNAGPHHGGGYRLTATLPLATPGVSSVPRASSQGRVDQGKVSA